MNNEYKKEILRYIIKKKGHCEDIVCRACPLNTEGIGYICEYTNKKAKQKAKQMLYDIEFEEQLEKVLK